MLVLLFPETCLFEYARQRARRHVDTRLAGNRHRPRFSRVSKLTVTSLRADKSPSISLERVDDVSNLHRKGSMPNPGFGQQPRPRVTIAYAPPPPRLNARAD